MIRPFFPAPSSIPFLLLCCMVVGIGWGAEPPVDFSRDVLPILSDTCFQCHGPDAKGGRKGDLRLDDEADAKRDRGGFRVVTEGKPEDSELLFRLLSTDPEERMPPPEINRSLSPAQIDTVRRWIAQGAGWGRHWAFEPVRRPEVPPSVRHPMDSLVERRLEGQGIKPNPPASRETLIRRLSLDLTGLPPTPRQIDEFLADSAPGAWERLVDRTLASPAFGERMAWDWLEAARYADSNGYQGDLDRTMWPWRDWVTRAFNDNLTFDQFTIWQLAGDLLPGATEEQILATGFNRNHMINGEGGRIAEENRVDYVFDMTETMGTVWLGLTLNCCRCHDHKFDPLTQRDYYQMTAFFNQTPVDGSGGNPQTPPVLVVSGAVERSREEALAGRLAEATGIREDRRQRIAPRQPEWESAVLSGSSDEGWRTLDFSTMGSRNGQTLVAAPDGAVLVSGKNPDTDAYTLSGALPVGRITALWLEAVRHPSMTKGGFARSDSGNFVLTELEMRWRAGKDASWQLAPFSVAEATVAQGGYPVAGAIDGNPDTGWAVYDGNPIVRDQRAVFRAKEPVELPPGAECEIVLRFDSPHKSHNLGHFRLAVTDRTSVGMPGDQARVASLLRIPGAERTKEQADEIRRTFEAADPELRRAEEEVIRLQADLSGARASLPKVMVMADLPERRPTYLLDRGLYTERRDEVSAAVPAFLPSLGSGNPANRLGLARWLVSPEHPLTARVVVNRLWQNLFGIGLVKTAEDFGVQADVPVQPELLDWLAAEFVSSGWDVKHLSRVIVTSDVYRRSSDILSPVDLERDPLNRFLARGPRFRMPSWMIRDQALAVSGLLQPAPGGPPVYPYQPDGVWAEATFGKVTYKPDQGTSLHRRSLYTFWRRIVGPTMFFDTAKRQVCEVKPLRTNTPMHALTILNDVTYVEAARALAQSVLRESSDADARMEGIGRRVLGRVPSEEEKRIWKRSLDRAADAYGANKEAAERFLSHGEFARENSIPVAEMAAWAALCLNLLNLDETLTKE